MGKLFKILQHIFIVAILLSSVVQYHHHISDGSNLALCLLHVHGNPYGDCDGGEADNYSDDGCPLHLANVCRLNNADDSYCNGVQHSFVDVCIFDDCLIPPCLTVSVFECFYAVSVYSQEGFPNYSLRAPPVV